MSDHDERKRRGIRGAARELRKEVARGGGRVTQEQAERRVRTAVVKNERKRND